MILWFFFILTPVFAGFTPDVFVDTYYMWDLQRVEKRSFTTQPIRHDQPSLNLAHFGAKYQSKNWRGRLVAQTGDSVERNAALEPGKEKYLQEAYLGYRMTPKTWLDGGIYLSHLGMESWISKDNPTYTRSLMSDYVPYYSTGLRIDHELGTEESLQLHLMQGWQIVSETNRAKSLGVQYKKKYFTYNNFFGEENISQGDAPRFRQYHNFIIKKDGYIFAFDLGIEEKDTWGAIAGVYQFIINERQSLTGRIEHYFDPRGTNVGSRFITQSASVNFDQRLGDLLWRNEARGFYSEERIYPSRSKKIHHWDGFLVTSLAFSY